ncbi:MAG: hypothetical protein DMF78_14640 [Acidobacteria bacterium]|nr:MAG: hypothetical protein DMF78_14640 [Acidobacteriota bacterium]
MHDNEGVSGQHQVGRSRGAPAESDFLRIHRSHLINLEHVTSIEPCDTWRVQVVMKSAAKIVASRAGSRRLRDLAL